MSLSGRVRDSSVQSCLRNWKLDKRGATAAGRSFRSNKTDTEKFNRSAAALDSTDRRSMFTWREKSLEPMIVFSFERADATSRV